MLAASDLVVVPSPGFVEGYLKPLQGYHGRTCLLENRIQLDEIRPHGSGALPSAAERWRETKDRWVIGWFGTLRCRKSMRLLEQIAERLGDRVLIYTRGYPTETGIDAYMEIVNRYPNWIYDGPYTMPDDLKDLYGRVHFVWCFDFLDEGGVAGAHSASSLAPSSDASAQFDDVDVRTQKYLGGRPLVVLT